MKKIYTFIICTILISACSLTPEQIFLIPVDTPTPSSTATETFTPAPTFTPVTPTLTFTTTPTLAGQKTSTSTPEATSTLAASMTPIATNTLSTPTATVQMDGFISVLVSPKEFYKGTKCQPFSVKFIIQVADPNAVVYVNLSVRFKSNNTDSKSAWTSFTLHSIGAGTFTHELSSDQMKGDVLFINPWVEYQLIAVDVNAREIGRTEIFKERLSALECVSTPTPVSTGVKP